jgi:hypothetical protein
MQNRGSVVSPTISAVGDLLLVYVYITKLLIFLCSSPKG